MTGPEIFSLVKEKKTKIEDLFDPTTFVLNKEVEALYKEIDELQANCPHNFVDGVCEYCGKEEQKMSITLYKSATCPQCKVAKMKLDKKGLTYEEVYVENMDAAALAECGIMSIPTLVVNGEKITSVRAIASWIDAQEASNG